MNNQAIYTENLDQFLDTIAGLVARGLTFRAYHDTLTIVLTGGF